MSKTILKTVASALVLIGTCCAAPAAWSSNDLFPASGAPKPSGAAIAVRVGSGSADALRISPVTFLSRPGTNRGEGSKTMCGLVIAAPGRRPQGVVTVGTGVTEATPSCDAVLAVGAVPASPGQKVRRIGIIHAVSSRNAADGRTAVVLRRDQTGKWLVDDAATARAETMTRYTIAELRRKVQ